MNRPAQYHISDPVLPWVYSATEADAYFDHIEVEREKLQVELSACKERYGELIMAVERKYPNETRHETALRCIREAENQMGETQEHKEIGG